MHGRRSFAGFTANRLTPSRKVIRKSASTKDLRILSEKISLERVLGLTATNTNGLTCNPLSGILAYPAGCVIVLLNSSNGSQSHIFNPERKTITALTFSSDGKYLASGECGHNPSVRVWEIGEPSVQTCELQGHKYGINCVEFSPNMKYLVSIGDQHDMLVNIWNWRTGDKVACNKIGWKVRAMSFSASGNFFVTVGNRHVKFWYFDTEASTMLKATKPINGRSAILGDSKNCYFCDVACGTSKDKSETYGITKNGLLCAFSDKRILYKFVDLNASSASCLAVNSYYIFCGCSDGAIRVFSPSSLDYITSLPRPHCLGVDVADGVDLSHFVSHSGDDHCPDLVAMALDNNLHKLTCIYNDHSMYCWDIKSIARVTKASSYMYHSACIWGIETYPYHTGDSNPYLPYGCFLTCSSDDTIRIWNLEDDLEQFKSFPRNVYSKELLKVTYTDKELSNLKDISVLPGSASSDGKSGIRCLRVSPDGQLLAVGDRSGNLRVYDLQGVDSIVKVEAHESEILCVEFSPSESGFKLLASSSRDRLIHIFDVNKDFSLIQTIDEHSSSITAVRFNYDNGVFQLLSCGSDKSIMFHRAQISEDGSIHFTRNSIVVGKATMYDMDIDPTRKLATTVGQDRNLRVYDIQTAKQTRCYKGTLSDDGTLIKIQLDPSGVYAATSCSDKSFSVYDFDTGDCVAIMHGHSEIVTGLSFSNDGRRLISVSGDGCIFIWRIPLAFRQAIAMRMRHLGMPLPKCMAAELDPFSAIKLSRKPRPASYCEDGMEVQSPEHEFSPALGALPEHDAAGHEGTSRDYRFSIGRLPLWAKKQYAGNTAAEPMMKPGAPFSQASGRWAQTAPSHPSELPLTTASHEEFSLDENAKAETTDCLSSDSGRHLGAESATPSSTPRKSTRSSWSRPDIDNRLSKSVPNFKELSFDDTELPVTSDSGSYVSTYAANRSSLKRSSFFKKARQELMHRLSRHGTSPPTGDTLITGTTNNHPVISKRDSGAQIPALDVKDDDVFDDAVSSQGPTGKDSTYVRSDSPPTSLRQSTPIRTNSSVVPTMNVVACDILLDDHDERGVRSHRDTDDASHRVDVKTSTVNGSRQSPIHAVELSPSAIGSQVSVQFNGKASSAAVSGLSTTEQVDREKALDDDDVSLLEEDLSDQERPPSDDESGDESPLKEHFEKLANGEPVRDEQQKTPPPNERDAHSLERNIANCRSSISAKFLSRSQQSQTRYRTSNGDTAPQRQLKSLCNLIDDQPVLAKGSGYQAKPVSSPSPTEIGVVPNLDHFSRHATSSPVITLPTTETIPGFFPDILTPTKLQRDDTTREDTASAPSSNERRYFHAISETMTVTEINSIEPSKLRKASGGGRTSRPKSLALSFPTVDELKPAVSFNRTLSEPEADTVEDSSDNERDFKSNDLHRQSLSFTIPLTPSPDDALTDLDRNPKERPASDKKKCEDGVLWLYQVGERQSSSPEMLLSNLPERDTDQCKRPDSPIDVVVDTVVNEVSSVDVEYVDLDSVGASSNAMKSTHVREQINEAVEQLQSSLQLVTSLQSQALENNLFAMEDDVFARLRSTYVDIKKNAEMHCSKLPTPTDETTHREPDVDDLLAGIASLPLKNDELDTGSRQCIEELLKTYSDLLVKTISEKFDT